MNETQNVEWKQSRRDEYLEWICGFANAQGGRIFIGMDDSGEVVGVKNAEKLMEDIPSKIRQQLGLVREVNLHEQGRLNFIEILVKPIRFEGIHRIEEWEYPMAALREIVLNARGRTIPSLRSTLRYPWEYFLVSVEHF